MPPPIHRSSSIVQPPAGFGDRQALVISTRILDISIDILETRSSPHKGTDMVLCRIVPSGSVPHRYRTNLYFVCGSLRYDVVYNLDEDSKKILKIMLSA